MIRVEHLSHYYGELAALDDVSFSIEAGNVVGLLGLNGAGKSTMLKILSGISLPTAGAVFIDGVDVTGAPDHLRRRIGFLPDQPPLYGEMRVDEYLRWCGEVRGRSRAQVDASLGHVLATCGIEHVARTVIAELSHGYRKRVGIAQTIIHEPALVLLDEPISGLDPVQIVEMREVVRALAQRATVMISSHILSEVAHTCDHLVVLDRGRLRAQGPASELVGDGAERTELRLRGDRAAIEAALAEQIGPGGRLDIEALEPTDVASSCASWRVVAPLADDASRASAVAALVAGGVGVAGVAVRRTELEALFLRSSPDTVGGQEDGEVRDAG